MYSDDLGRFTTKVKDMFTGFEVIKSFNIEKKAGSDYDKVNNKCENSKFRFTLMSSVINAISGGLGTLMFMGAMLIGVYFVIQKQMSLGQMLASTQLMNNVINPLGVMSDKLAKIKSAKAVEEKINDMINSRDESDEGIQKINFTEKITFNNVEFSYNQERKILDGTSITIEKGQKYAIVGGSGSGKSTLLKLLLRFYEDYKGSINIDNEEVRDIKVSSVYKLISIIHQDVFMFDDTIENNITLYGNYHKSAINDAINKAGLRGLVESLSNGGHSLVGENGSNLSGGEQQRIAIARALIKKTPILVLDEATSSLDNENAYNIENFILSLEELTCLVVTHKLNREILSKYDEIIVLKDGKVAEVGKFDELLNKREYFYSLYNVAG